MRVASFDIGKKNFAFCVQDFPDEKIIAAKESHISNSESEDTIIKKIENTGEIIYIENMDLTSGCSTRLYLDPLTFKNMADELNSRKYIWEHCDVFVVEQQLSYKGVRNPMALKLGQHCMSYFWILYPDKLVVEFPSFHKSQVLGAPREYGTITKNFKNGKSKEIKDNVKRWAIRKADEVLVNREDSINTERIRSSKKKDDLSDCILHGIAYVALDVDKKFGQKNRIRKKKGT